jgi:sec-independent protein translocase protein TatC
MENSLHTTETYSSILDHLEELRTKIIIALSFFLVSCLVSFLFVNDIYYFLIKDIDQELTILSPGDVIWVNVALAALSGLVITTPLLAFLLWNFMAPAMTPAEKKSTIWYVPALFFLFAGGLAFSFYIVFPLLMNFITDIAGDQFQTMFTVQGYFGFLFRMTIPIAVLFEMPAVFMFLTSIGFINPNQLVKSRKYAYFILIIISVLITPADFLSDILVILPLLLLFEISISCSKFIYRRKFT